MFLVTGEQASMAGWAENTPIYLNSFRICCCRLIQGLPHVAHVNKNKVKRMYQTLSWSVVNILNSSYIKLVTLSSPTAFRIASLSLVVKYHGITLEPVKSHATKNKILLFITHGPSNSSHHILFLANTKSTLLPTSAI